MVCMENSVYPAIQQAATMQAPCNTLPACHAHGAQQFQYPHSGGRSSAFATSTLLTMLVLIPFPRPSTLATSLGIL